EIPPSGSAHFPGSTSSLCHTPQDLRFYGDPSSNQSGQAEPARSKGFLPKPLDAAPAAPGRWPGKAGLLVQLEHCEKCLRRDLHASQGAHLFLALLLLFQQLLLAADVAAVALGQHILPHSLDGLPGDDPAANGRLDRHLEQLPGDVLLQLLAQPAGPGIRLVSVGDEAQGIHRIAVEFHVHLHQLAGPVAGELIIQRGVALGVGLQRIEEVVDDLVQRHLVVELHQIGVQVLHVLELPPPVLAHGHDVAHELVGSDDVHLDIGLLRVLDHRRVRVVVGIVHRDHGTVGLVHVVDDGGQGGHQIQVELPLQPLLDHLHVEHAQKAAPEAEAQGYGALRLKAQRGVVQLELFQRVPQVRILGAVLRVDTAVDHGLHGPVAGQGLGRGAGGICDGVAHTGVLHVLDGGGEVAHLAGPEAVAGL
ncbi:Antirestriction protein (ArdA), partial [Dysosmobacter welbionis]